MTEVAIYQPGEVATAAPPPSGPLDGWILVADQVVRLAEQICSSPFVPDGLRGSVPATAAAILAGRELGIPPMTALANVHVIKGKTGISALLMRALIQAQGHDWEDVEVTDTRVVVRGRRRGETEWTTAMFTADQARRAHIDLGGYPQDKLYARATSRLARRKFADVIAGMPYSAEELEDDPGVMLAGDPGYAADHAAERAAAEPAKPRTAQRRQRAQAASEPTERPAGAPSAGASEGAGQGRQRPAPAATARSADAGLPPLPGEDEDPTPGPRQDTASGPSGSAGGEARASSGQVGIIRKHFDRLGFTDEERDQRLAITSTIAACDPVGSTKELSQVQAKAVMDTLSRCRDREALIVLLSAGDQPDGDQADGEATDA